MGTANNASYGDKQHLQTITGLTPGTKYYYKVTVNGTTKTGSFVTPPATSATSVKFLAYGDTRTHPASHDAVAARINATCNSDPGYQSVLLSVGDLVSSGYNESPWNDEFFNYSYPQLMNMFATIPYMSAVGNHELSGSSTLFNKYFPYNFVGGRYYYSFDYGPAHFAVVDQYTDYTEGSPQITWLKNDLANSTKPWKFIYFHVPGWSAGGGHENEIKVQQVIQPICVTYNVPIVFAGHNHYYARAAVPNANGTVTQHVTAGAAGAPLYVPNSSYPYIVLGTSQYHFCKISIEDNSNLKFEAVNTSGTVIDQFTINRNIPVTGVSVSPSTISIQRGLTGQLTATVLPGNASNKAVTWATSNPTIATVNSSGLVTAHLEGSAEITVTTVDGGFTAKSIVNVTPPLIITLYAPVSATLSQGTIKSGSYLNLQNNDASYFVLNSKTPKPYVCDWYGKFMITENPANVIRFTINYDGKYSRSLTQILYLYNFSTNSWVQINSRSVGTTDVLTTFIQNSPTNYISSLGEIRVRVYASTSSKSYICSGDWMQIKLESIPVGIPSKSSKNPEILSVDNNAAIIDEFTVYPNPAENKVTCRLNINSNGIGDIVLYDLHGNQVVVVAENIVLNNGMREIEFNTNNLSSGVYFCKLSLRSSNGQNEEKLIKLSIQK
jgi:uncharacterized protein YjdB